MSESQRTVDGNAGKMDQKATADAEFLARQFTTSDPEGLPGVSDEDPPNEDPEVEFAYNMVGRETKVRCVYCKYPNHYKGIVVKYPSGARRLVGRDCALSHHSVAFENQLMDFETAMERQDYERRRRRLMSAAGKILDGLDALMEHPAVKYHDSFQRDFRVGFPDIAKGVAAAVRRREPLTVSSLVRDSAGEMKRKEDLGARFEEVKQAAKDLGAEWRLYRVETESLGMVAGSAFFSNGVPTGAKLSEIRHATQDLFGKMSHQGLTSQQIKILLLKLTERRDELVAEHEKLEALPDAFAPDNLARMVRWANHDAREEQRIQAEREGRKVPPHFDRFTLDERGVGDSHARVHLKLHQGYRAPERELLMMLTEAAAIDRRS